MAWLRKIPFIGSFFKKDEPVNNPTYYQCIQLRDRAAYALFLESHMESLQSDRSIYAKLEELTRSHPLNLYNSFKKKHSEALYPKVSEYTVKKMRGEETKVTHYKRVEDEEFLKYYKNTVKAIPMGANRQKHFQDNMEGYQRLARQSLETTTK